jgi:hypothetical protein
MEPITHTLMISATNGCHYQSVSLNKTLVNFNVHIRFKIYLFYLFREIIFVVGVRDRSLRKLALPYVRLQQLQNR